jgi:hypothetical protein
MVPPASGYAGCVINDRLLGSPLELSDIIAPDDSVCAGAPVVLKVEITLGDGDLSWLADRVVIPNARSILLRLPHRERP